MRRLNLIAVFLLASFALAVSPAQGATTVQSGDWNLGTTWDTNPAVPGAGDNTVITFPVNVPTGYDAYTRAMDMNGAAVTVGGTGTLNVNHDVTWNTSWASDSTHNTFTDTNRFRSLAGSTWTHDGDLTFATRYYDQDTGSTVTFAGTGLLTLGAMNLWRDNATVAVDRDLSTGAIAITHPTLNEGASVDLISGTTTTGDLFVLGTGEFEGTVNFLGEDALLRVLTSDLSVDDANAAIGLGLISDGVTSPAYPLVAEADGLYTKIGFFSTTAVPEPSTFALFLGGLGALVFLRRRRSA